MAKYYVCSGKQKIILEEINAVQAAANCLLYWKDDDRKVGRTIRVSEVGFDFENDHEGHLSDAVFPTSYVKALIK